MRRPATLLLAILLILSLSACSAFEESADERIAAIQQQFSSTNQRFSAEITADYGDRVYQFTLRFDSAASTLEVLAPELIAGATIGLSESGTVLYFEDAELNTGALTDDGLTPVSALPAIVQEWKAGYITECHYETYEGIDTVVMTTQLSDTVNHITWFDNATGIPIKAELVADGFTVITCIFEGSPLLDTN